MLTRMNQARERHGSACVDGHIYVVGGLMAGKQKRKPGVLSEVERFNPRTQYWENVESLPRRCYSPGVINYKNKLYVIGGVSMTDDSSSKNANSSQTKVLLDLVQGTILILKLLAKFQTEKGSFSHFTDASDFTIFSTKLAPTLIFSLLPSNR